MAIWNGLTEEGAVVPIQVDAQGRVVVSGGGGAPSQVYGTAKASGSFSLDASTEWALNCSAVQTSTGLYVVSFATPMADTNYAPFIGIGDNLQRITAVDIKTTSSFTVHIWHQNGSYASAPFNVVVFDNKPTDVTPLILPSSALQDIQRLKDAVGLADS